MASSDLIARRLPMSLNDKSLAEVAKISDFLTRGITASNSSGERVAYLAGERRSNDVCVFLNVVLDNSSSMGAICGNGKTRLQVALDCLKGIVNDKKLQLARPDSLVVHTFNGDVIIRLCCHPDKYNHGKLLQDIESKSGNGSYTRMRDAIEEALANMEDHPERFRLKKEVVRYLLVLTDGEDNKSTMSQEDLARRIDQAGNKLKNLHVVILAVGMSSQAVASLQTLCNRRVPVLVFNVLKADDVGITEAFSMAMEHLRALLVRDEKGNLTVTHYIGRDSALVKVMDMKVADQVQKGYKDVKLLQGGNSFNEVQRLMLQFGQLGTRGQR